MDSCFSLTGAHQRRVNERGKSPCIKDLLLPRWVQSTLCKRQLHTTHVGAVGWELHGSSATIDMRGEGGSGVTLIYVPVAASGKRKTEENLIFHDNFIQCFTEKLSFFCAAFLREYSCICSHNVLLLPLSTLCCLLEISKRLWHCRWRRSEWFALKAFQNLNGVI